jgi:hypothetical protein
MKLYKKLKQLVINIFKNKGGEKYNYQCVEDRKEKILLKYYLHNPMRF